MRDVVIAGINRDEISALVILDLDGCRIVNPALFADDIAAAASDPIIRRAFADRLVKFLAGSTGSSTRITRAVLLETPLSIDRGDVTDQGSVNQRWCSIIAELVEAIYSNSPAVGIISTSDLAMVISRSW